MPLAMSTVVMPGPRVRLIKLSPRGVSATVEEQMDCAVAIKQRSHRGASCRSPHAPVYGNATDTGRRSREME